MKRLFVLFLLCVLLLASCAPTADPLPPSGYPPTEQLGEGWDHPQKDQFLALFDPRNRVSMKLDITDAELAKLQADYEKYRAFGSKSPIYRMADLYVEVTRPDGEILTWEIPQVGVRMKGNTSRLDFYADSEGMYNLIHFKVSFDETFDDPAYYGNDAIKWGEGARMTRKGRTFATLSKIDLRWNRNDDTTYIREGYAYDLYRENGVLAPHTAPVSLQIGDDRAGVFTVYEPIDEAFLQKYLPEEALGGDLYKCGWTYEGATFTRFTSFGVEDEDSGKFYIYDLKTNQKTSAHQSLQALIKGLNDRDLDREGFAALVDPEPFLTYCAVSYLIGNPDDLRNNYNNTYLYFRADTGKAVFIPYDTDRGLGVNTWNPYGDGMTADSPFSRQNVMGEQRNPLFLKSVCEGGMFLEKYVQALRRVAACEMLTEEVFLIRYEMARALYEGDTAPSREYRNAEGYRFAFDIAATARPDESANMSFADYLEKKRRTLFGYIGTDQTE